MQLPQEQLPRLVARGSSWGVLFLPASTKQLPKRSSNHFGSQQALPRESLVRARGGLVHHQFERLSQSVWSCRIILPSSGLFCRFSSLWEFDVVSLLCRYSQRIASMGSMRAARSAGKSEARLAMMVSAATDPTSTQGSRGEVPYRKLASAREAKSATPRPAPAPRAAIRAFSPKTIAITRLRCAPNAMRIPISLVRRAVAYASVP